MRARRRTESVIATLLAIALPFVAAACGERSDDAEGDAVAARSTSSTNVSSTSTTAAAMESLAPATTGAPPPAAAPAPTTARRSSPATAAAGGATSTTTSPPATSAPATTAAPPASTSPPTTAPAAKATITIANFAYSPPVLRVAVGTEVEATNTDAATHTWTADGGAWDSGNLGKGDAYTYRFTSPGTFAYHCTIHPSMKGTVSVEG